jgi:hypothetical protein
MKLDRFLYENKIQIAETNWADTEGVELVNCFIKNTKKDTFVYALGKSIKEVKQNLIDLIKGKTILVYSDPISAGNHKEIKVPEDLSLIDEPKFIPKVNQKFWYVRYITSILPFDETEVSWGIFGKASSVNKLVKAGNCFKTKKQATYKLHELENVMKECLNNGN